MMKRNLCKISIYHFKSLFLIFWKFFHHFANNNKQYTQSSSYLKCRRWFFAKLLKTQNKRFFFFDSLIQSALNFKRFFFIKLSEIIYKSTSSIVWFRCINFFIHLLKFYDNFSQNFVQFVAFYFKKLIIINKRFSWRLWIKFDNDLYK